MGITEPTVAPMPMCTSGIAAIQRKMKGQLRSVAKLLLGLGFEHNALDPCPDWRAATRVDFDVIVFVSHVVNTLLPGPATGTTIFVENTAQRSNQLSYGRISRCGRRGLNPQPLSSCSSNCIRAGPDAPKGDKFGEIFRLLSQ